MAAPRYAPNPGGGVRSYQSPDVVPAAWSAASPGLVEGTQPHGAMLGSQGPDQGFALTIAERLEPELKLQPHEKAADAIRGCVGIATRRASLYSRAPMVHDLRLAFTIWGFFDATPPSDLVQRRHELFEGVGIVNHHYAQGRRIVDLVPESTLRLTPAQVADRMPGDWRDLTGA